MKFPRNYFILIEAQNKMVIGSGNVWWNQAPAAKEIFICIPVRIDIIVESSCQENVVFVLLEIFNIKWIIVINLLQMKVYTYQNNCVLFFSI